MIVTMLVQKGNPRYQWHEGNGNFSNFVSAWRLAILAHDPFIVESNIPLWAVRDIIGDRQE